MFIFTGLGALLWLPGWLLTVPRDERRAADQPKSVPSGEPTQIPWRKALATARFLGVFGLYLPLFLFLVLSADLGADVSDLFTRHVEP